MVIIINKLSLLSQVTDWMKIDKSWKQFIQIIQQYINSLIPDPLTCWSADLSFFAEAANIYVTWTVVIQYMVLLTIDK